MFDWSANIVRCLRDKYKHSNNAMPFAASLLNGRDQYIECINMPFWKKILSRKNGFTISVAVRPQEDTISKFYVVYSIASHNSTKPHVIFAKRRRQVEVDIKAVKMQHIYVLEMSLFPLWQLLSMGSYG